MTKTYEQTHAIEVKIIKVVIEDLLAAGFNISVIDGEDVALKRSGDADKILNAMFSTEEDIFNVWEMKPEGGWQKIGFVYFVYDNDGHDVITDSSARIEPYLKRADALANEIAESEE